MTRSLSPLVFQAQSDASETSFHRFLRHFDWILFLDVIFLCLTGMVMVYSASLRFGNPEVYMGKQLTAFMIGMGVLFVLATINYQIFSQYPKFLFFVSMSLLVMVLVVGTSYRGTRAWFTIGPFSFQPSEIAKLITILVIGIWCRKLPKDMQKTMNK